MRNAIRSLLSLFRTAQLKSLYSDLKKAHIIVLSQFSAMTYPVAFMFRQPKFKRSAFRPFHIKRVKPADQRPLGIYAAGDTV